MYLCVMARSLVCESYAVVIKYLAAGCVQLVVKVLVLDLSETVTTASVARILKRKNLLKTRLRGEN